MNRHPHHNPTRSVSGLRVPSSRRQFLGRSLALGLGVGAFGLLGSPTAQAATALDYTDPATFDAFHRRFIQRPDRIGQSTDLNEWLGALAWGQSYIQVGLMRMYEKSRDPRYLHELAGHVDDVLATRDSVRGVTDYRGLSLPAWRSGHPYTMGGVDLRDAGGRPVLQIRTVRTPIERLVTQKPLTVEPLIDVVVTAGTSANTFRLTVTHRNFNTTEVFDNLSMDRQSPDYVVDRVHAQWQSPLSLTVKDLRADAAGAAPPAAGTFNMSSVPAVFGVHTGQIAHPMTWFARTVKESATLRRDRALDTKADEFIAAAEAAVAVHDDEWRENDRGEGWYIFRKGDPSGFDGAEAPANQFLALGRAQAHLAAVTGDPRYANRFARMARTLHNQMSVDEDGAYIWHYWPTFGHVYNGWETGADVSEYRLSYSGARQIEDISHAHLDVDFAVQAFRDGVVFQGIDMSHLAKTFTRNLIAAEPDGAPTVWFNVDGTFRMGVASDELVAAGWMPIASWDERVFEHCLAMYESNALTPEYPFLSGYMLMGVANLASLPQRQ